MLWCDASVNLIYIYIYISSRHSITMSMSKIIFTIMNIIKVAVVMIDVIPAVFALMLMTTIIVVNHININKSNVLYEVLARLHENAI